MFEPRLHVFVGLDFLLKTKPMGVSTYCRRKKNFGYAFVQNQLNRSSFLSSSIVHSGFCLLTATIPRRVMRSSRRHELSKAGVLFLTPLQKTQRFSGQRNPLEEGREAEGMVAAWLGDVRLRTEQC